jgi:hypothetical protein
MHEPEQHLRDIFDNFTVVIPDDVECGRGRLAKVPVQGAGFRYWDGLLGFEHQPASMRADENL